MALPCTGRRLQACGHACVRGECRGARACAQDEAARQWRVQAVSVSAGSFENRKSLPKEWQGLRDEQLSQLSGIPGCVFVHASGARALLLTPHLSLVHPVHAVQIDRLVRWAVLLQVMQATAV